MPHIILDGFCLYYEVSGAGAPAILIPGLGGSAGSWRHQVGPFSERFRCIVYDHMGTGRSGRPKIPYTVDGMADDLLRLMDALDIDAAHLVGHSTGGAIAQTIACRAPERVRRMVLHASWAKADAYFRTIFSMRREMLCKIGIEAYLRSTAFFLFPPWWINQHQSDIERSVLESLAEQPDLEILINRIDAIVAFDRSMDLPSIVVPSLVIAAANDILMAPHFARQLADLIPNAQLSVFPDGGHVAHQTTPAVFNQQVLKFLLSGPV